MFEVVNFFATVVFEIDAQVDCDDSNEEIKKLMYIVNI